MVTVAELIKGYGPNFPALEEVLGIEPDEAQKVMLESPSTDLGRYLKDVKMLSDVTSQRAVGMLRFDILLDYFFCLNDILTDYDGLFKDQKVVHGITIKQKEGIMELANGPADVLRAEAFERFTEHDTAAAGDYLKVLIGTKFPELEHMIEGIHFANTSEDVMANVFGKVANRLVYGYFMPALMEFANDAITFVEKYEKEGPVVMPALTHKQPAEPTTLGKKIMTRLDALAYLFDDLVRRDGEGFRPFSGKLGGAIGDLKTHYAAYPDIDWEAFAERFVREQGLHYHRMTDQCAPYVVEAHHYMAVANILTEMISFTENFIDLTAHGFFIKEKKKGAKGSSIMPNKTNMWNMEGAKTMLGKSRDLLIFYAKELPSYPHEGNMQRSYAMRDLGTVFMPVFIGLNRIRREMNACRPNTKGIAEYFDKNPGMAGSVIQTILKRAGIEGDAYRIIQGIAINPDGSYANGAQFKDGLERAMGELTLSDSVRGELRATLEPSTAVMHAHRQAHRALDDLKPKFAKYMEMAQEYKAA